MMRYIILLLFSALSLYGQTCGQSVRNPRTGLFDCIGPAVPGGSPVGGGPALTTASQVVCVDTTGVVGECNSETSPAITKAIGATSTDGLVLANTTAATVGAQKWSPRLRLTGRGWKTDATAGSQAVDWITELVPVQGAASPTSTWAMRSSIDGGAYSDRLTINSGAAPVSVTATGLGIGAAATSLLSLTQAGTAFIDITRGAEAIGTISAGNNDFNIGASTNNLRFTVPSGKAYSFLTGRFGIGFNEAPNAFSVLGVAGVYGGYTDVSNRFGLTLTSVDGTFTFATVTDGTGNDNQSIVFTPSGSGIVSTAATFKAGGYQSSDGTAGATGTCLSLPVVKNGLVVSCGI